jgi:hypothetical protein
LFSLHVVGNTTAVCDLEFNISANPGVFLGHWRGSFRPNYGRWSHSGAA